MPTKFVMALCIPVAIVLSVVTLALAFSGQLISASICLIVILGVVNGVQTFLDRKEEKTLTEHNDT